MEFEVHTHPKFEKQIVDILRKTTEIVPGIYNDMSILVSMLAAYDMNENK